MMGLIKAAFHQNRRIFAPENQSFLRGVDLPEILEETPTPFARHMSCYIVKFAVASARMFHATLWGFFSHRATSFHTTLSIFFGATTLQLHNRCMTCDCPKYSFEENETRMPAIGGPSCTQAGHKQTERDKMSKDTNDINLPVVKFPGTFPEPSFRQPWTSNTNMWRSRLQFDVFHR